MAATTHKYSGQCRWAKVYKADDKFPPPRYTIDVLMSMDDYTKFKATGAKNNGKPEDGKMWVTFRRKEEEGKPIVVDADGNAFDQQIGNGSLVTVKATVDQFKSKKYGSVTRVTLDGVQVDKLQVYNPDEGSTGKPKILF